MTYPTAQQIYDELVNKFQIKSQVGHVNIVLGNVSARYSGRDAIGDLLQEWFSVWLQQNNYSFRTRDNTQQFPDFLLSKPEDVGGFLEVKTFNADASPAFDIANFDSYCKSLLSMPERLDADYLIFAYRMEQSNLSVENIWLKKVWELCAPSKLYPLKLQVKNNQIYNIRPCKWYSSRIQHDPFQSVQQFLSALVETQDQFAQCDSYKTDWLPKVNDAYKARMGNDL